MTSEYLDLVPQWALDDEKHDLVLSNDIDSLASCAVLKKVKGWDIKYFYDFEKIYKVKDYSEENEKCWVDVAIREGHAFDNHVSKLSIYDDWNENMINLNQMFYISKDSYMDKYAGSTLLEVWSLYDLPLPETDEGKMLLLAIDVSYKGFYVNQFRDIQKNYLVDILGMKDLYEVIKKHKSSDFDKIIKKYGLNSDIICKNGTLSSSLKINEIGKLLGLELSIPDDSFDVIEELELIQENAEEYYSTTNDVSLYVKTLALPFKDKIIYSKICNKKSQDMISSRFVDMIRRRNENVRM